MQIIHYYYQVTGMIKKYPMIKNIKLHTFLIIVCQFLNISLVINNYNNEEKNDHFLLYNLVLCTEQVQTYSININTDFFNISCDCCHSNIEQ